MLERVCVVLVEPSHPGNVGAAARAMRAMGVARLRLVKPRFAGMHLHRDARALAAGADALLEAAEVFDSLPAALADRQLCIAVSAEGREFGPQPQSPEAVCDELLTEATATALVFGPERTGLSVADVGLCQRLCSIPTDATHSSLNLAQAVQVLTYVLRVRAQARGCDSRAGDVNSGSVVAATPNNYANQSEVEGFFEHFEQGLVAIRYLDPAHPKKLMSRMRRLFGRTRLETEEIHLLRGICKLMIEAASRNPDTNLQSQPGPRDHA